MPLLAQQEFGVFTSMGIDTARTIFGFTPRDEVILPSIDDSNVVSEGDEDYSVIELESEPNTLDIDFNKLIIEENNGELKELHNIFLLYSRQTKINIQECLKDAI